jgi:arylsulfatase A-like enzyme
LGINYYAGLIRGSAQNYNNWVLTENGTGSFVQDYTTEKFTDLAIDWIGQQEKPWFMWLAHNAPHTPFHLPPQGMHSQGNLPEYVEGMDEIPYYMAAIEAMDFQIGRLLDSLPNEKRENTIIIFIGDNGTPNQVAQAPYKFSSAKGSLNQGGINVPMFVSGKGVTRSGIDDNLTSSTDLFSTIAELAGVDSKGIHDSKSFNSLFTQSAPIREFQYSEKKDGNKDLWTISNGTLKLIENANGNKELYNLQSDPYESNNLLDGTLTSSDMNAKSKLEEELLNIRQ